jgi:ketol-acid reductoisomerase
LKKKICYYDADVKKLPLFRKKQKEVIGILGYGIQGRAQALNLRDSGYNVFISNKNDHYKIKAIDEGFKVVNFKKIVDLVDVLIILIPDADQKAVLDENIISNLKKNQLLIFAHGYNLYYKTIKFPKFVDIAMLAPRFPGKPIRERFLEGSGVSAFIDSYQDNTKKCLERTLIIALALGFTRSGVLRAKVSDETEADLFIEHFMAPLFYKSVEESVNFLKKQGLSEYISVMELYFSGELGSVRTMMSKRGLYKTLYENASPTCKFGVSHYMKEIFTNDLKKKMKKIFMEIRNKKFLKLLEKEQKNNYKYTNNFFAKRSKNSISKIEKKLNKLIIKK